MSNDIPLLTVAKILDKTTLVLTGVGLEHLRLGDEVSILSFGPFLEGGIPLVLRGVDLPHAVARLAAQAAAKAGEQNVSPEGST